MMTSVSNVVGDSLGTSISIKSRTLLLLSGWYILVDEKTMVEKRDLAGDGFATDMQAGLRLLCFVACIASLDLITTNLKSIIPFTGYYSSCLL